MKCLYKDIPSNDNVKVENTMAYVIDVKLHSANYKQPSSHIKPYKVYMTILF